MLIVKIVLSAVLLYLWVWLLVVSVSGAAMTAAQRTAARADVIRDLAAKRGAPFVLTAQKWQRRATIQLTAQMWIIVTLIFGGAAWLVWAKL